LDHTNMIQLGEQPRRSGIGSRITHGLLHHGNGFECLAQVIGLLYCLSNTDNHRGTWINRHISKLLPRLSLPLAESLDGFAERGIERS
jgi:hypothetical protein